MELNPNHKVSQAVRDQWHKIAFLLMRKFGQTDVTITLSEIETFCNEGYAGIAIAERPDHLQLRIVTPEEGNRLARAEGGMPV